MKADIIILTVIIAYCLFIIVRRLRKSKDGACGGCSCGCSGCGHSCASDYSYENLFGEKKQEQ